MSLNVAYISSACNKTVNIADWGKNNLICYGSSNVVLIYDLSKGDGKVTDTLHGHTGRVNAVQWIKGGDSETELVSVATDHDLIVWSYKDGGYKATVLKGHTGIVNVVYAFYRNASDKHVVVATAGADSTIKIWQRLTEDGDFSLYQNINLGHQICLSIKIAMLPETDVMLLACAMDDSKIDLYVEEGEQVVKRGSMKGHDDWVRGLDFSIDDNQNLLLASSSQDCLIRLWKLTHEKNYTSELNRYITLNELETPVGKYIISVESVIAGHDGWIYSVNWSPDRKRLLSASMDKTMIIWELDAEANLWLENTRVGNIGGNTLGFYGGMFGPDGRSMMAHGYHGAFHIWRLNEEGSVWEPQVTVGGHFGEVVDLAWDPLGEYVMSVSCDQTTRIHAPWRRNSDAEVSWHEIARPQVHGYDMSCLAMLGRYKFASGAEEKIIRTFNAPDNFVQNFKRICHLNEDDTDYSAPKGASVPSLGLSNKAVYGNDNAEQATVKSSKDVYPEESHFTAMYMIEPPTEETLLQNTLWPEIQKLYGHGYEVYSMAASSDGKLLASACKATTLQHASVIVWDTSDWQILQTLPSHTLTIAQLAFSPDCNHILSVSRDRRWTLFSKNPENGTFDRAATTDKKTGVHTRIIWCCAWSHDSKYFATGSRDGRVVVWRRNDSKVAENVLGKYETASEMLLLKSDSITALAFASEKVGDDYLLAVGVEKGFVQLYRWSCSGFKEVLVLNHRYAHHQTVKRLAFRPLVGRAGHQEVSDDIIQLASCGSDHAVRIYDINKTTLQAVMEE